MKILGIMCSPRKNGNSDILIEKALEGARSRGCETEKLVISGLDISPCNEIEYQDISPEGLSVVEDDMRTVFDKMEESDAVIVASPVFFGTISAQAKIMIDRFQCVWLAKNVYNKDIFRRPRPGGFICVQASQRDDFFENSRAVIKHFFATIGVAYTSEVFCGGVDNKGEVSEHPDFLKDSIKLGECLADRIL